MFDQYHYSDHLEGGNLPMRKKLKQPESEVTLTSAFLLPLYSVGLYSNNMALSPFSVKSPSIGSTPNSFILLFLSSTLQWPLPFLSRISTRPFSPTFAAIHIFSYFLPPILMVRGYFQAQPMSWSQKVTEPLQWKFLLMMASRQTSRELIKDKWQLYLKSGKSLITQSLMDFIFLREILVLASSWDEPVIQRAMGMLITLTTCTGNIQLNSLHSSTTDLHESSPLLQLYFSCPWSIRIWHFSCLFSQGFSSISSVPSTFILEWGFSCRKGVRSLRDRCSSQQFRNQRKHSFSMVCSSLVDSQWTMVVVTFLKAAVVKFSSQLKLPIQAVHSSIAWLQSFQSFNWVYISSRTTLPQAGRGTGN